MINNKTVFWTMAVMLVLGAAMTTDAVTLREESATLVGKDVFELDTERFVRKSLLETKKVPLTGWKIVVPGATNKIDQASLGLTVREDKAMIGGREVPTLVVTASKSNYKALPNNTMALVELDFPFDAREWNILSFRAKVETFPEDLGPKGFGTDWPRYGLPWSFHSQYVDNFGIDVFDGYGDRTKGYYDWASFRVPKTFFPYHHVRRDDVGLDGFKLFQWDMINDDTAGNKRWFLQESKKIRICYETQRKNFKPGEYVKITIADMRLVKGAETKVDDYERYCAWLNFVENYKPNYSDSSKYLKPPKEGRIKNPVRLAKRGKALAEIVVDLTDAIRVEKWVKEEDMQIEHKVVRGSEFEVASDAARELKLWLDKITGANFPVVTEASKEKKPRIFLGASYAAPLFKDDIAKLAKAESIDGFAIREKDGDFYIFGVTPNGTRNGVYTFLEKNTDWIWAFYARDTNDRNGADEEQGAVYTKNPNLTAVWGDAIEIPVFISRNYGAPNRFKNRMRLFQYFPIGGHVLSPQYYDWTEGVRTFNPILFGEKEKSLRWTESRTLVCMNDPNWDEYTREWEGKKRFAQGTRFAYMDGLDDNFGFCTCEKCTAPFVGKDGKVKTVKDFNEFWSSWLFRHYNKLADARVKTWPGYESGGFCYFMSAPRPAIEVSENYKRPWICTYVRKSQVQPIFAPLNQHWWRTYKDWTAHSPNCQQYDYYMLFSVFHPLAEVVKFDLQAMRDLHFLRAFSEGNTYNEFLGMADERWCISQLYWNPDADVEELHRYFNRRVYREAAPWIDKYRGAIRSKWYKEYKHDLEFDDKEGRKMVDYYGMDKELRGYLQEAYKAAKHPKSKYFVAKMAQEYVKYMNNGKLDETTMIEGIPVSVEFPKEGKEPSYVRPQRISPDQRLAQVQKHLDTYKGDYPLLEEDLNAIMNWVWSKKGTNTYYEIIRKIEGDKKLAPEYKTFAGLFRAERELTGTNYTAYLKAQLAKVPLVVKPAIVSRLERQRVPYTEIFPDAASQEWFDAYLKEADSFNELSRRRQVIIGYYANLGYTEKVTELYNICRRDCLATKPARIYAYNLFSTLLRTDKTMTAEKAIKTIDDLSQDFIDQAIGWMTDQGWNTRSVYLNAGRICQLIPSGKYLDGIKIYQHYIKVDSTGNSHWVKEDFKNFVAYCKNVLRNPKADKAVVEPILAKANADLIASLKKLTGEGTFKSRGYAKLELMNLLWPTLSKEERIKAIDECVSYKWVDSHRRLEAAKKILEVYAGDWDALATHMIKLVKCGDWSDTHEYSCRGTRDRDYRLDYAIDFTAKMAEAGKKDLARKTLQTIGEYLGYKQGNEKIKPFNTAPEQFKKRFDRYTEALNRLK